MSMQFKNPPSTASTVGSQIVNQYYAKKALVELPKLTFFTQLADVTSMPKNYGKKIKRYHYMPLLDDRNINDQGLDASGASYDGGNLYGSSKDIGTIPGKMPALSETGGRVNRVGFKRIELEGTLEKFGFFDEYTQESMDFDTDEQLLEHINREMILGANEIIEDSLQIDLIASAGVVRYAGTATGNSSIDENCVVSYGDLMRTSIQLDQNRCPKQTKIITGSRMIDTKTIPSARVAYIGSELLPIFKAMKDLHNNPAFVGVERYGDAVGTTLNGEIGTVDQFRLVVHPEMMKWAGAGATADDASFHATAGKYDVFPILVVGDESFTTIGFQTDGKTVKFKIMHKAPGEATANQLDPYGETGFMSIKWYYGFMCLRPERIALIKTAAKM